MKNPFIELISSQTNGEKLYLNVNHIMEVIDYIDHAEIRMINQELPHTLVESYKDIKKMINDKFQEK